MERPLPFTYLGPTFCGRKYKQMHMCVSLVRKDFCYLFHSLDEGDWRGTMNWAAGFFHGMNGAIRAVNHVSTLDLMHTRRHSSKQGVIFFFLVLSLNLERPCHVPHPAEPINVQLTAYRRMSNTARMSAEWLGAYCKGGRV